MSLLIQLSEEILCEVLAFLPLSDSYLGLALTSRSLLSLVTSSNCVDSVVERTFGREYVKTWLQKSSLGNGSFCADGSGEGEGIRDVNWEGFRRVLETFGLHQPKIYQAFVRMRGEIDLFRTWCNSTGNVPEIYESFQLPATALELEMFRTHMITFNCGEIPLDLYALLCTVNGQSTAIEDESWYNSELFLSHRIRDEPSLSDMIDHYNDSLDALMKDELSIPLEPALSGMFGGYHFNDHIVNLHLVPLSVALQMHNRVIFAQLPLCHHAILFARSVNDTAHYFVMTTNYTDPNNHLELKLGEVVTLDRSLFPVLVASSLGAFVREWVQGLCVENRYTQLHKVPQRFLNTAPFHSYGLGVTASPLFAPELSLTHANHPTNNQYVFLYRIQILYPISNISVDHAAVVRNRTQDSLSGSSALDLPSAQCQLAVRKWVISDFAAPVGSPPQIVRGEGVVGLFPTFTHGEHKTFQYNSCTHFPTPQGGSMSGVFYFVRGLLSNYSSREIRTSDMFPVSVPPMLCYYDTQKIRQPRHK